MELSKLHRSSSSFSFTESGLEVIKNSSNINDIVDKFVDSETDKNKLLDEFDYIGCGNNSIVRKIDGHAVKLSTDMTGRKVAFNGRGRWPENLIDQLDFLDIFAGYLERKTDGIICTPKQHFAIKNLNSEYLKVEEFMSDWIPISEAVRNEKLDFDEQEEFYEFTKNRIVKMIGSTILKIGITDAGLGKNNKLHGGNILVPKNTPNLYDSDLCLIDQPARGIRGRIATNIIRSFAKNVPQKYL